MENTLQYLRFLIIPLFLVLIFIAYKIYFYYLHQQALEKSEELQKEQRPWFQDFWEKLQKENRERRKAEGKLPDED